ncbi:MAG: phospholipase D-like domain-containing protein [Parachlamydiaceae bacterium]|nr:phospholipase D-like domain-containing protein [Parachlamydiaceae bacterium]
MAKRKKKSILQLPILIKNSSISAIIFLFAWVLFQLVGHFPTAASVRLPSSQNSFELYSNQTQDNLTNLYVNSIDQAKTSITLLIYALMDENIIGALRKKTDEGVPVHIVCDGKASPGITKKIPKSICIRHMGEGLMHQKVLIIDQEQILIGSANLTYSSLNTHGNLIIGLNNPSLAQALIQRAEKMDEDGSPLPVMQLETNANEQLIEFWALPNEKAAVNRVIKLLQTAQKSIKVAMFTWTRIDFTNELIAASKRGVQVEAVLDRYSAKGAGAKVLNLLKQGKISVTLSTGQGLLHHKFAYIDDSILINGSANWTMAAFNKNFDNFMVIHSLTSDQQNKMNQLWKTIKSKSSKS